MNSATEGGQRGSESHSAFLEGRATQAPVSICMMPAVIIPAVRPLGQATGSWHNVGLCSQTLPGLTVDEEALLHLGHMTLVM